MFVPLLAHAQGKRSFLVNGRIKSVPDGAQVILLDFNGTDTLAVTTQQHGTFSLQGLCWKYRCAHHTFSDVTATNGLVHG
jgi:hypothetical protein